MVVETWGGSSRDGKKQVHFGGGTFLSSYDIVVACGRKHLITDDSLLYCLDNHVSDKAIYWKVDNYGWGGTGNIINTHLRNKISLCDLEDLPSSVGYVGHGGKAGILSDTGRFCIPSFRRLPWHTGKMATRVRSEALLAKTMEGWYSGAIASRHWEGTICSWNGERGDPGRMAPRRERCPRRREWVNSGVAKSPRCNLLRGACWFGNYIMRGPGTSSWRGMGRVNGWWGHDRI